MIVFTTPPSHFFLGGDKAKNSGEKGHIKACLHLGLGCPASLWFLVWFSWCSISSSFLQSRIWKKLLFFVFCLSLFAQVGVDFYKSRVHNLCLRAFPVWMLHMYFSGQYEGVFIMSLTMRQSGVWVHPCDSLAQLMALLLSLWRYRVRVRVDVPDLCLEDDISVTHL